MKIALMTTTQNPCSPETGWGVEGLIWNLAECLDKLGHIVTIFGKGGSQCPDHGGLVICDNELEMLEKYKNCTFDITHDISATKLVHDYCQRNNIKSIATNFNVHFLYPKILKNIVCGSERQKYLGLQGKSGFEGTRWEKIVQYTGRITDAKVVYYGLNNELYTPNYNKEDYFLYFNSFDERKGVVVVIKIAQNMGFNLKVAGEVKGHIEHQQTFEQLKPLMDSMPNVEYFTDVTNEQKIKLMQNAKALLFPSLFEQPFATVVIEALACGTPIITTNIGGMPELVKHCKTGFLCNTPDDFRMAILGLNIINPRDCREDAVKRFDRMIMTNNYLKLYNDILNGEEW